jgi:hypothetical protein
MSTEFKSGDKVEIRQDRSGEYDVVHGKGVVDRVLATRVILVSGSVWRKDGYEWGSQPTRGIGRSHCRRIVKVDHVG